MRLIKSLGFILLTLAGVAASAQTFEVDGINYNVLSEAEGTVEVTSGDYSGDVVIPAEVSHDGSTYRVTTIGDSAFYYCNALTSIDMPAVTTVRGDAFSSCYELTSVSMPAVTTIGEDAFIVCSALVSVSMQSVTTIDDSAFSGCYLVTSVSMPAVTTIGDNAFSGCSSLASVFIPSSCTSIGDNPFVGCVGLKEIVVDDNNPNYSSADGVLYDKGKTTLIGWPAAKGDIDILPSVTTIGDEAFSSCYYLTSVTMPSVTSIGVYAFATCTELASVSMPSVTTIGDNAFATCTELTSVSMPSLTTIGDSAFSGCSSLASVFIPASCTSIGLNPFAHCIELKEFVVDGNNPNYSSADGVLYDKDRTALISWPAAEGDIDILPSVTTIGDQTFFDYHALTSVSMPSVTTIGDCAFWFCSALASIDMPSVTTIGGSAFFMCGNLSKVDIPASVTMIGDYAFTACSGLTSVYCHWEQPLECDPRFDEMVLTTATLYVPDGCVDAYRAVKPWSDFANIEEGGYSGIADTPQPEVTVKVIDGVIVVEGGDGTASAPGVEVYSTGGVCVWRGTDSSIGGLPHGVYVVRVGSTVQKVAL